MKHYKRLDNEATLPQHNGIFRNKISLLEAVALLTPIGAGVFGIPYAVAQVGIGVGIMYMLCLGFLMMGLNLLVGEVMVRTKGNVQLVGLAKKYLGTTGEILMTIVAYLSLFGALVVYTIGIGEALAAMLPGAAVFWSLIFFAIGTIFIIIGLKTIKTIEFFCILGILVIVLLIATLSTPHVQMANITYTNLAALLFPYGVILFAFNGMSSIPEAHSVLRKNPERFKKAIVYSTIVAMVVYIAFALAVVGVTGTDTTPIATIGLGQAIGPVILVLGNLFAVFAMGMAFFAIGVALKDSLIWDYKLKSSLATLLVCGIPLLVFLLGLRQFIAAIDIVGGLFGSIEFILLILIYYQAKRKGDLPVGKYRLHHTAILAVLLFAIFAVGTVFSVVNLL